jgi:hypothetical protein
MDGTCSTGRDIRNIYKFQSENLKGKDHYGEHNTFFSGFISIPSSLQAWNKVCVVFILPPFKLTPST